MDDIDKLVVLEAMSLQKIGEKYDLHPDAIARHRDNHIDEAQKRHILVQAKRDREAAIADELNEERIDVSRTFESLARRVEKMITKAEEDENPALALSAAEGLRKVLHDIAQLQGKLANQLTVQVTLMESREWLELRDLLELLFERHPAAKDDFLQLSRQKRLSISEDAHA